MSTYSASVVEFVTGISSNVLRVWESRDIYRCDLRRQAEQDVELLKRGLIRTPAYPVTLEEAEIELGRILKGWRRYTAADLVRLVMLRQLTAVGVEAKTAGEWVQGVLLEEASRESVPAGLDLSELLTVGSEPYSDTYLIFAPSAAPIKIRYFDPSKADNSVSADIRSFTLTSEAKIALRAVSQISNTPGIILNLSEARRTVIARVREHERRNG